MIPRGYIDAWRSDAKVEQNLIIARSILAVFSNPVLSRQLVFRGGTPREISGTLRLKRSRLWAIR